MAGLSADTPKPTNITVHQQSRVLEVGFDDGAVFHIPFELMRIYSPSAEVQGHGPGQEILQTGKQFVRYRRPGARGQLCRAADLLRWSRDRHLLLGLPVLPGFAAGQLWQRYEARLAEAGVDRDAPMPEKSGSACGHHH